MSEIRIRQTIPDAWAEQGHCPLCAAPGMRVQHPVGGADQLQCTACGVAFEVELDGARLHVSRWPEKLQFLRAAFPDGWTTAAGLRTTIQQVPSPAASAPPPVITSTTEPGPGSQPIARAAARTPAFAQKPGPPAPDPTEIAVRVANLRSLGNSPKRIRSVLTQSESDPERIRAILEIIAQLERREQARQGKKLRLLLGIVAVMALILAGAGFVLQKNHQNEQTAVGSALQGTVAPDLVTILNLNTPVVVYGAAPPASSSGSGCPRNAAKAAALFGGQAADWTSPSDSNGWVMIRQGGQGLDVYIPGGMKASYLQLGEGLQLVEVKGPAILKSVNYIAVSCP